MGASLLGRTFLLRVNRFVARMGLATARAQDALHQAGPASTGPGRAETERTCVSDTELQTRVQYVLTSVGTQEPRRRSVRIVFTPRA